MITSAEHVDVRQFYTQLIQEYEGRKGFQLSSWPSTSWALIGWCQMFTSTKLSSFPIDILKLLLVASLFHNWHSRMATFFFRLSVSSWIKRHSLKSDFNIRILQKTEAPLGGSPWSAGELSQTIFFELSCFGPFKCHLIGWQWWLQPLRLQFCDLSLQQVDHLLIVHLHPPGLLLSLLCQLDLVHQGLNLLSADFHFLSAEEGERGEEECGCQRESVC